MSMNKVRHDDDDHSSTLLTTGQEGLDIIPACVVCIYKLHCRGVIVTRVGPKISLSIGDLYSLLLLLVFLVIYYYTSHHFGTIAQFLEPLITYEGSLVFPVP